MKASVIIAARNGERTAERAVLSATAQSVNAIEVLVVDDGSSDGTAATVARLANADARVRLLQHERSQGVSAARHTAVAAARGDWLAALDADDWFDPEQLKVLTEAAEERGLDVAIDNLVRVDSSTGASLGQAFPSSWMTAREPMSMSYVIARDTPYCQQVGFGYCKPLFNRLTFINKVGRHNEDFHCSEDVLALLGDRTHIINPPSPEWLDRRTVEAAKR